MSDGSSAELEPVVMSEVGHIVECVICHNPMVIFPVYVADNVRFRHVEGSPRCKPNAKEPSKT